MNDANELYVFDQDVGQSEWDRLKTVLAAQEHLRTRRDYVLMAWGLVLAFGSALAGAAEPLGLAQYVPQDLPLWIMASVGAACFVGIAGLLLQYRVLREHAADIALRREIEERLELSRRKLG